MGGDGLEGDGALVGRKAKEEIQEAQDGDLFQKDPRVLLQVRLRSAASGNGSTKRSREEEEEEEEE